MENIYRIPKTIEKLKNIIAELQNWKIAKLRSYFSRVNDSIHNLVQLNIASQGFLK